MVMRLGNIIRLKAMVAASIVMGVMVSCSTLTQAEREAKKAERAKYVTNVLNKRHYKIDIDMMHASHIGSQSVRSNWSLEVKGDTLVSYLPYFGVAHSAVFGNSQGLNFTAPIKSYKDSGFKKDKRNIDLKADSEEDHLEYHLEVMDNGSAFINVISQKRESISYSGEIAEE